MKANELMIGDLVTYNNCPLDAIISLQITALGELGYVSVRQVDEAASDELNTDDLAGIPLTITFLAKNFPTPACGVSWWPNTFHPRIHCEIKKEDYGEIEVNGNFEYIHELQHALRLCGINKEIVL